MNRQKLLFMFFAISILLFCYCNLSYAVNFTNNGNGTVTDRTTGLMWQQAEGGLMEWGKALLYCKGLSLGGYSDWLLPSIEDLWSITDHRLWNPAINTTFFPKAQPSYYWSSTMCAYCKDEAWVLGFSTGGVGGGDTSKSLAYVRCVRGGRFGK